MLTTIRRWLKRQAATVDREAIAQEIAQEIDDNGELEGSYLFMCAMASGIATIGLLCNSVSVIIGAMLVSPLMGPIVRLGLGMATLDIRRVFRALGTLLAGMGLALLIAILIVRLSPLRTPTPEILARTTPNLFDMIAATLSGLAGGYAMIRQRGGTIVGVAIATALMPPMAVVGFGIAVAQWRIAEGSLLLFTTNLATIALSATLMCTWYGFSGRGTRAAVAWQVVVGFAVLLPLGWPLAHALGDIASQTRLLGTVRSTLTSALSAQTVRVLDMQLDDTRTALDVTFAAQHYDLEDDAHLREALKAALPPNLALRLSPVIMADPTRADLSRSALSANLANAPATPGPADEASEVVTHFPLPPAQLRRRRFDQDTHPGDRAHRPCTAGLAETDGRHARNPSRRLAGAYRAAAAAIATRAVCTRLGGDRSGPDRDVAAGDLGRAALEHPASGRRRPRQQRRPRHPGAGGSARRPCARLAGATSSASEPGHQLPTARPVKGGDG